MSDLDNPRQVATSWRISDIQQVMYNHSLSIASTPNDVNGSDKICDALTKLKVPQAGFIPDIEPFVQAKDFSWIVAPVSTILFVPKSGPLENDPKESNIPAGKHFTDMPAPRTIVLLQQPPDHFAAVLGKTLTVRLLKRGIRGIVANGRIRDANAIGKICRTHTTVTEDGFEVAFSVWSKGTSTVGPASHHQAWCTDVPVMIGEVEVKPGDFLYLDEREKGLVVVPQELAARVVEMFPVLKDGDERRLADVEAGMSIPETAKRNP